MSWRYACELGAGGWTTWAVVLALGLAFAWHARKSPAGWALGILRGLAAASLALTLLKPSLAYREPVLQKPRLLILLDHGHSMQAPAGSLTRLEAAKRWLKKNRASIEARAEVIVFSLAGRGRRLSGLAELEGLNASQAAFQAAEALRDVIDDAPATASAQRAWLFSDGNSEEGVGAGGASRLPGVLAALRLPVDALASGEARRGRSLHFLEIRTPDFAFLHGRLAVQTVLEASGLSGRGLRLRLLAQRESAWVPVAEERFAAVSDYETFASSLSARAETLGSERYRLEAEVSGPQALAHDRALSRGNAASEAVGAAAREFRVEVIRQKYRIMYLAGRPSPEYAFLREFLKSDPNYELVSFVILRNPDNPAFVPDQELSLIPFPADEIFVRSLSQFDLFILENFSYARFNLPPAYLSSLKGFVAAGGALLVMGGENAFSLGGYRGTPLDELLPVALAGSSPDYLGGLFKPRPAAASHPLVRLYDTPEASASAWEALPPLDGFARFESVKPQATVLAVHPHERTASGEPLPVLAIREFGRGKVMLVSSDSTWRWRLGSAADWRVGSFYGRFWSRAVQYLTGNLDLSKVKFAPLPDRLAPREPLVLSLRVFDEGFKPAPRGSAEVSVLWTMPGGRLREVLPQESASGIFTLELTGLSPGSHRLRARAKLGGRPWGEDEVPFEWQTAGAFAPPDRRWLKGVAEVTGGTFHDIASASAEELLESLPSVREEAEVRRRYHLWAEPWWLALMAALFLSEWSMRRWRGHA